MNFSFYLGQVFVMLLNETTEEGSHPDFLYAALYKSGYAAFFTESRMRLIDSNKIHRKSGLSQDARQ
jgi:hypothetical protein